MRKIMQHRFLALLAMLMISLVSLASQPQGRNIMMDLILKGFRQN